MAFIEYKTFPVAYKEEIGFEWKLTYQDFLKKVPSATWALRDR